MIRKFLRVLKITLFLIFFPPAAFLFAFWIEWSYESWITVDNISAADIAQINKYYPPLAILPEETIYEKMEASSTSFPSGDLRIAVTVKMPIDVYEEIKTSLPERITLNEESLIGVSILEKTGEYLKIRFINSQSAGNLIDLQTYCKNRSTSHHLIWLSYWVILILIVVLISFPYRKFFKWISSKKNNKRS